MNFIAQNISDFWVAHYDPFYVLCGEGALAVVAVTAASWYFPVLRSLAGAVVMAIIAGLVGYRKGEQADQIRQAAREREAQSLSPKWPWSN